jgi:hypothetical protein
MKLVLLLAIAIGIQAVALPRVLVKRGTGITGREFFKHGTTFQLLTTLKSMVTEAATLAADSV